MSNHTVSEGIFHPFRNGINYKKSNGGLFVAMEDGTLIIRDIRDEHGVDVADMVSVGDRFYTPSEYLESAKSIRAVYTSDGSK